MTQYNTLDKQLCNSQLNRSKSGIKNSTKVTLKISSNVVSYSNDETNFPHKLLSANTKIWRLRKTFTNGLSANINYQKLNCIK